LLPHQDAAWKIINERLDALAQGLRFPSASKQASARLAPLTEKLQSMSQDIAAHASKNGQAGDSGSTRFPDRREP